MPINTNTPTGRSCRAWNGRAEGRVNVVPKMIHLTVHPKERSETETQFRGSYDRPNLSETFQSSGFGGCLAWTAFRNAVQAWSELWSGFSTTTLSIYAIYVYLVRFACILESGPLQNMPRLSTWSIKIVMFSCDWRVMFAKSKLVTCLGCLGHPNRSTIQKRLKF